MENTEIFESYYEDTREIVIPDMKCDIHGRDKEYHCVKCSISICVLCLDTHKREKDFVLTTNESYEKSILQLENHLNSQQKYLSSKLSTICESSFDAFIENELKPISNQSSMEAIKLKLTRLMSINKAIDNGDLKTAFVDMFGHVLSVKGHIGNKGHKGHKGAGVSTVLGSDDISIPVVYQGQRMCYNCKKKPGIPQIELSM
jgi:hypothetical protein